MMTNRLFAISSLLVIASILTSIPGYSQGVSLAEVSAPESVTAWYPKQVISLLRKQVYDDMKSTTFSNHLTYDKLLFSDEEYCLFPFICSVVTDSDQLLSRIRIDSVVASSSKKGTYELRYALLVETEIGKYVREQTIGQQFDDQYDYLLVNYSTIPLSMIPFTNQVGQADGYGEVTLTFKKVDSDLNVVTEQRLDKKEWVGREKGADYYKGTDTYKTEVTDITRSIIYKIECRCNDRLLYTWRGIQEDYVGDETAIRINGIQFSSKRAADAQLTDVARQRACRFWTQTSIKDAQMQAELAYQQAETLNARKDHVNALKAASKAANLVNDNKYITQLSSMYGAAKMQFVKQKALGK